MRAALYDVQALSDPIRTGPSAVSLGVIMLAV